MHAVLSINSTYQKTCQSKITVNLFHNFQLSERVEHSMHINLPCIIRTPPIVVN